MSGVSNVDPRVSFFEAARDLLCVLDAEGVVRHASPSWFRMLGVELADLIGQPLVDLVHPADCELFDAHLASLRFGARRARVEARLVGVEGRSRWMGFSFARETGSQQIHGVGRDITDRRVLYEVARGILRSRSPEEAVEAVLDQPPPMACDFVSVSLFDGSEGPVSVYRRGPDGLHVTAMTAEEHGDIPELCEGRVQLVGDAEQAETLAPAQVACAQEGMRSSLRVPLISDGQPLGALTFGDRRPSAFVQKDVLVAMELARQVAMALHQLNLKTRLAQSEQAFRSIAANADGLLVVDSDGVVCFANRGAEEMFGLPTSSLVGQKLLMPLVAGDQSELRPHNLIAQADPSVVVETHVVDTQWNGAPACLASLRDVTDRRSLQAQLLQAQKMGVVGRLAGGVSHDFNNLLTAMMGNLDLLRAEVGPDHAAAEPVDAIAEAVDRAAGVARQLLAFSRQQVVAPRIVDLNHRARRFDRMLRQLCGEDVELVLALQDEIAPVMLDPVQLEQVLMNLVLNARDSIPERGTVRVTSRLRAVAPGDPDAPTDIIPGRYVELAVEDDGTGMPEEVAARVFEPFFTTKPVGKGLGLGMPTVGDIVAKSQGFLLLRSKVGLGTRVAVFFPAREQEHPAPVTSSLSMETLLAGAGCILVVDDEAPVRQVVEQGLRLAGFEVHSAGGGIDALRLVQREGVVPDVLLTDVRMPEMNGVELSDAVRSLHPSVRTLFMSGYSEEILGPSGVLDDDIAFLSKPFRLNELLQRLRALVSSARAEADGA